MWWLVATFIISLVIALVMPRPQVNAPKAINEVTAPTATVGREIAVLFGTRDMEGPNCVWWGALRLVPIKKKGGKK